MSILRDLDRRILRWRALQPGRSTVDRSVGGRIDSAFPALKREERAVPKTVTGTLGGGDASLNVNSVSGAITLLSRPGPAALAGEEEDDR